MDVDSGYLVNSAVPNLLLDVMDLISLRGGLAFPASLPVNSDGPSNKIILIFVAFLVFLWRFAQKTGSQNVAEIFYFCFT